MLSSRHCKHDLYYCQQCWLYEPGFQFSIGENMVPSSKLEWRVPVNVVAGVSRSRGLEAVDIFSVWHDGNDEHGIRACLSNSGMQGRVQFAVVSRVGHADRPRQAIELSGSISRRTVS